MQTSKNELIELTSLEGVCLRPYFDSVGVITIGIGATISEIPNLANWDKTQYITLTYAFDLLKQSLMKYEKAVNNSLIVDVSQEQFDALVSLCYNIGTSGLSNSTLIRRINSKSSLDTIAEGFMMWNKPREIIGRRTKEKDLYVTGKYSNNGTALLTDTDGKGHELTHLAKTINVNDYLGK